MAGNSRNKRISGGVRKTVLSKTPILIRHTEEESRRMKALPYLSLASFRGEILTVEKQPHGYDWRTLYFRALSCLELATKHFNEESAVTVANDALLILISVKDRRLENGLWRMSPYEIDALHTCLLLVDQMQDLTTRKEQLIVWSKINPIVHKFDHLV